MAEEQDATKSQAAPFPPPEVRNLFFIAAFILLQWGILKPWRPRLRHSHPKTSDSIPAEDYSRCVGAHFQHILVTTGGWKTDNLRLKLKKGEGETTTIFLP